MGTAANRWDLIIPISLRNRFKNPSFERSIAGLSAVGSTLSRVSSSQRRGAWSAKAVPTSSLNDGCYQSLRLPALQSGVFSVDVLGASGVPYKIYVYDNTAATVLASYTFTGTGLWQRVQVYALNGSNTDIRCYVTKNNSTSTADFYVDGWAWNDTPFSSDVFAYFDGDTPGAIWESSPHMSSSLLSDDAQQAGLVLDLEALKTDSQGDSDILVMQQTGTGHPPVQNQSTAYGVAHGSKYQRSVVVERPMTLMAWVRGDYWDDMLHTRRQLLSRIRPGQPMQIRYRGRDANLIINVIYESGLEISGIQGFSESPGIRFMAYDPFWREEGSQGKSLSTNTVAIGTYVMQRAPDGTWSTIGNALNGLVRCIAISPDGVIWIGGDFTTAGATTVNRFAYYDPATNTWLRGTTSGTVGANGSVYAIEFRPDGVMFVGGAFSSFNGVANTDGVAKFDPSTGTTTSLYTSGFGVGSTVLALKYLAHIDTPYLVMGGRSTLYNNLAYYSGFDIQSLGGGTSVAVGEQVYAIEYANRNLYVGGRFSNVYDTPGGSAIPTENFAIWKTDAVTALPSGTFTPFAVGFRLSGAALNARISSMLLAKSGDLVIGGLFDAGPNAQTVNSLCRFNGVSVFPYGDGCGSILYGKCIASSPDGSIWVASSDVVWDGIYMSDSVAQWSNSVFFPSDGSPNNGGSQLCLASFNDGTILVGYDSVSSSEWSASTTVTNDGTAPASCRITVRGPGTLWRITNGRNGATLCFTGCYLIDGEYLSILCGQHEDRITSSFRGDMSYTLVPGSNLSNFFLEPGSNNLTFFFAGVSGSSEVAIDFSKTHWSIDGSAA